MMDISALPITSNFPSEVILEEIIMKNKDISTLVALCSSNKTYRNLCNNDIFWYRLYEKHYGNSGMDKITKLGNWYSLFKLCYQLDILLSLPEFGKYRKYTINTIKRLYIAKHLEFRNGNIKQIPKEFGVLINLTSTDFDNNQIKTIPHEFGNLKNLRNFHAQTNQIENLPPKFGELEKLEFLYLSQNQLQMIPIPIFDLINL